MILIWTFQNVTLFVETERSVRDMDLSNRCSAFIENKHWSSGFRRVSAVIFRQRGPFWLDNPRLLLHSCFTVICILQGLFSYNKYHVAFGSTLAACCSNRLNGSSSSSASSWARVICDGGIGLTIQEVQCSQRIISRIPRPIATNDCSLLTGFKYSDGSTGFDVGLYSCWGQWRAMWKRSYDLVRNFLKFGLAGRVLQVRPFNVCREANQYLR